MGCPWRKQFQIAYSALFVSGELALPRRVQNCQFGTGPAATVSTGPNAGGKETADPVRSGGRRARRLSESGATTSRLAGRTCAAPWPGALPAAGVQSDDQQALGGVPGVLPPMAGTGRGRRGARRWVRAATAHGPVARDGPGGSAGGAEVEIWPAAFSRVTDPFRSGPGPAGGCRRAGNRPATQPSAAGRLR